MPPWNSAAPIRTRFQGFVWQTPKNWHKLQWGTWSTWEPQVIQCATSPTYPALGAWVVRCWAHAVVHLMRGGKGIFLNPPPVSPQSPWGWAETCGGGAPRPHSTSVQPHTQSQVQPRCCRACTAAPESALGAHKSDVHWCTPVSGAGCPVSRFSNTYWIITNLPKLSGGQFHLSFSNLVW